MTETDKNDSNYIVVLDKITKNRFGPLRPEPVQSAALNCKNISIRKSTLRGYLHGVSLYSQANCGRKILLNQDTNLPTSLWKEHQMIKLICDYQSRVKGPANKKDPLTKFMITHMRERARFLAGTPD